MTVEEAIQDIDENEYYPEKIEHESLSWALDCMRDYKHWRDTTGEWQDRGCNCGAKCSLCNCRIPYKYAISGQSMYVFCPKCGKKMKPMPRKKDMG